ncbi:hypothetical protein Mhypo_02753 [Meiothermus hypogaeus]|uniref:Uncharacterized protein n=1 Tax=Meiothermus hypogaeus TaxID=884155 RepID=A0ABX9MJM0_9DEIN|nr:hypothetical protein Mhypo_02753 [Meiothermus hypogaeus]
MGRILPAFRMAAVRPAWMHSSRKTELSTTRACAESPKETLEMPRMKPTSGSCSRKRRIPSTVHMASLRVSSSPWVMGKVSKSKRMDSPGMPCTLVRRSYMRRAISTLRSTVLAMPASLSSSMVRATSAAPWRLARAATRSNFSRPSSRFTEFRMARPPRCSRASSITSGWVESIMMGMGTLVAKRFSTSRMSRTSSRPVQATETSSTWAPSATCSAASSLIPSKSPANSSSRNFLLPVALVRSPTIRMPVSCLSGTLW